jgi:hypothetical protein
MVELRITLSRITFLRIAPITILPHPAYLRQRTAH